MFKTIFSKQIMILVSIILIAFTIATSMFFFLINDVVSKDKENELENVADSLDIFMRFYLENRTSRNAAAQLVRAIDRTSESYGSVIMLIGQEGRLINLAVSSTMISVRDDIIDQFLLEDGIFTLRDARQYERAFLLNEGTALKDIGDFYGLFSESGYPWLNLQKKYVINLSDGQDFVYIISMHAPMQLVQAARNIMLDIVINAAIISSLISVVVGFFFSRRLTRDIRKINEAAKVIANGNFSERIMIESKDEIGQLAETFNHMVVDLENLETMRRDFIANVSHELRTPMTSIKGFIEGILDGTIPQQNQERYLKIVKDETERLNRLVNNLLDIARFESGEYKMTFISFDIVEITRRCVISFVQLIEEKNISVGADFDRDKIFVEGDVDSIERVVYNLLHNAIKFTGNNGNIQIAVKELKDVVKVSIQDDGIGIAEEELSVIWERFYKSDKSRGQEKIGTGLGLSIIKNIIKEHKQRIIVSSKLGEGTTFEFTLKRVAQPMLEIGANSNSLNITNN